MFQPNMRQAMNPNPDLTEGAEVYTARSHQKENVSNVNVEASPNPERAMETMSKRLSTFQLPRFDKQELEAVLNGLAGSGLGKEEAQGLVHAPKEVAMEKPTQNETAQFAGAAPTSAPSSLATKHIFGS